VRRLIEENPQAPALQKSAKDVTVLFLDIQGYTALSEKLAPGVLNEIVENYFSMYLADIRAAGGDINETAGDGLMMIFQDRSPLQHAASAVRWRWLSGKKPPQKSSGRQHPALVINMGIASGECDVGSTKFRGVAGERWTFTASGPHESGGAPRRPRARRPSRRSRDGQTRQSHFLLRPMGPVELKTSAIRSRSGK
jgi:hypothetical protein